MIDTGIIRRIDDKRRVAIPKELYNVGTRYQLEHNETSGIVKLTPIAPDVFTGGSFILIDDGYLTLNNYFTLYLKQNKINAFHIYAEGKNIILKGVYREKGSLLMSKDKMRRLKGVQCNYELCDYNSNGGCVATKISLKKVPYNNGYIVCCEIASNQTIKN